MNQHVRNFNEAAAESSCERLYRRLDEIDAARVAKHLVAYTPTNPELERLFAVRRADLGSLTSLDVIQRVLSANPDTISALALRSRHDVRRPQAQGFIAWLPLTAAGHVALRDGTLDPADPDARHVAGQHERPAAIYVWALYAPGRLVAAIGWAFQRWSMPACRDADIYARAVTPNGRHIVQRVGFEPCPDLPQENMFVFRRAAKPDARPIYDSYPSPERKYTVTVVRSYDDLAKVLAVRSVVYIGDQACPYDEEIDGNDFSSTHLLGYVGNEPAACLRIRCFAGFAKLERVAVLPKHRQSRLAALLVKAAHELCRMKGYTKVYGHAQERLVDFWERAGARHFPGATRFTFSDHTYVEMLAELPSHPEAIAIGADPLVIVRPEGRWHAAGVLDTSQSRPATCPEKQRPRGRF